ncbi:protein CMSS1 isoform X2, partial [Tachysurus ichikawai]
KTITDVLATSEPAPGSPADLRSLLQSHFSNTRSVIEQEELELPESCFLTSNDLTHSLSSYLKEVCPKWAKVQKQHTQKGSVVLLIVCSSALRTIELIKQLTTFKGDAKVLKLFAKHIKAEDQVKLLSKSVVHVGVGTPGRLNTLLEKEGLSLQGLRYLVLDWNCRDQKHRRMVDIPERCSGQCSVSITITHVSPSRPSHPSRRGRDRKSLRIVPFCSFVEKK